LPLWGCLTLPAPPAAHAGSPAIRRIRHNFRLIGSSLLFHEIIAYMRERGFGVIDMSEPHWRVLDFAFWQIDLFFVRFDRPEFLVNSYR
jgi:hypothetical protein